MLTEDAKLVDRCWVTVPEGPNPDMVAQVIQEITGEVAVVNDASKRLICIAAAQERVGMVRENLAAVGKSFQTDLVLRRDMH